MFSPPPRAMAPNVVEPPPKKKHGLDPEGFIGYFLTHFEPFWALVQKTPGLRNLVNRTMINVAIYKTQTRPYPFSTMSDYTSWASLTDRTYSSRHLRAKAQHQGLPNPDALANLFLRDKLAECPKSTVLFAYFAQWFTDGFLRTDLTNPAKNTSNHEIDLAPFYGLSKPITDLIREHQGGRLLSQEINGEEYPPYLCDATGTPVPPFQPLVAEAALFFPDNFTPAQMVGLFATGGDRANVQIGYLMFNVLFLREHNRIALELERSYPTWSDDRLFQTARNILTVLLIRVVVEEYINHISPLAFKFFVDPTAFPNERWYRQNWMAVEFTLVYRWHMLIPDELVLDGKSLPSPSTMWNTDMITSRGLGALFDDASRQPAGKIGLFNTPVFLNAVEASSVGMCRTLNLATYNDYLEQYGFPRVKRFEDISSDANVVAGLKTHYASVDDVDFYVGILADDPVPNSVVPTVIGTLVAIDAFSQALTNPLLNPNIYNEETFSEAGMRMITGPNTLADIVRRNIPAGSNPLVTLTRTDWKRT